ncbi:MAG: DUF4339 domain-containing protein [Halioglobus sp.]|nr:DUF4339 domain-containing protein [Halioglobus sp.]
MEILIWLVFGIICSAVAGGRGRNAFGWFFIGLLGGCFALIILFVLPDLKEEQRRERLRRKDRERVDDRIHHERIKNEAFRDHASRRLDTHDVVLEIDTKAAGRTAMPPPTPINFIANAPNDGWHYLNRAGNSKGPFSLETIKLLIDDLAIVNETHVWHQSLEDWVLLEDSPLSHLTK